MNPTLGLLLALALAGAPDTPAPTTPVDPTPLVRGTNTFAADLYRLLAEKEGNLFFSPYSIALCLAMTGEGARGPTREEMARVLHWPEGGIGTLHRVWRDRLEPGIVPLDFIDGGWREGPAYDWRVANRIFHQRGFEVLAPFLGTLRDDYRSVPEAVDYLADPEGARRRINDWVEEVTRKRIIDLLAPGSIDDTTRMTLVNALYLKARWADAFNERATRDRTFHTPTRTVTVPFLRKTDRYRYAEVKNAQVVEIPYVGNELSMVLLLPRDGLSLADYEATLTAEGLTAAFEALRGERVGLEFPKFSFRSNFQLKRVLETLGMRTAFDMQRADFTGVTTELPLAIADVVHQGFIAVDEHGTEAAAATAMVLRAGAADLQPVPFVADRPFIFSVRHRATNTVLFLGRVVDPS